MKSKKRTRLKFIAAATLFLTFAGGQAAVGHWTASTSLLGAASAASIGAEQKLSPTLDIAYSVAELSAAASLTVTNTGTRSAALTSILSLDPGSDSDFAAAIAVQVSRADAADECAPSAMDETADTLASGVRYSSGSDERIGAGESVTLCIQTSVSAHTVAQFSHRSVQVSVTSELEYAPHDGWRLAAAAETFTQSASAEAITLPAASLRNFILNEGIHIRPYNHGGTTVLARDQHVGDGWEAQWRFVPTDDGSSYFIVRGNNTAVQPSPSHWTAGIGEGEMVRLQDVDNTASQRWNITRHADGSGLQIASVAYPDLCVSIGSGLWNLGDSNPLRVVLAPCDDSSSQSFTVNRIGDQPGAFQELTPEQPGNPDFLQFRFTPQYGEQYYSATRYRVFFAHESTPDELFLFTPSSGQGASPWYPVVQISRQDSALYDFLSSGDGSPGNAWVYVEHSVHGSAWEPIASGKFHIWQEGDSFKLDHGWQ